MLAVSLLDREAVVPQPLSRFLIPWLEKEDGAALLWASWFRCRVLSLARGDVVGGVAPSVPGS